MVSARRALFLVTAGASLGACTLLWPIGDHALGEDAGDLEAGDVQAADVQPGDVQAGDVADSPSELDAGDAGDSADSGFTAPEVFANVTAAPRLLALNATTAFVIGADEAVTRVDKATRRVEALSTPSRGYANVPIAMTDLGADDQWIFLAGNEQTTCGSPAFAWKRGVMDAGVFINVVNACSRMTALANDPLDYAMALAYGTTTSLILHPLGGGANRTITSTLPETTALYSLPDEVYLVSSSGKRVVRVPKSGDAGVDLALTAGSPRAVVADSSHVYWIEVEGLVAAKPRTAAVGDAFVTLASEPVGLTRLAEDATRLYFTNIVDGTVRTVPKAGGPVVTIASDQGDPIDIAVDDSGIYWVTRRDGTLKRAKER
jgi:hypothetical protein